jgi:hypothetical protein
MSRFLLLTCSFSPDYAQLYERLQSKRFTYDSLIRIWVWQFLSGTYFLRSLHERLR